MNRFNLESLPLCGALTRSGSTCRRKGNKINGRCKLHGGMSTGPKTRAGKIASSRNAIKATPDWLWGVSQAKKEPMYRETLECLIKIKEIVFNRRMDSKALTTLIAEHKDALEVMKYAILENIGVNEFVILQSALDHYYRNVNAKHVKCHVFFPLFTLPHFSMIRSDAQRRYLDQWQASEMNRLIDDYKNLMRCGLRNIDFQFGDDF